MKLTYSGGNVSLYFSAEEFACLVRDLESLARREIDVADSDSLHVLLDSSECKGTIVGAACAKLTANVSPDEITFGLGSESLAEVEKHGPHTFVTYDSEKGML